jgi:hypothetical protein
MMVVAAFFFFLYPFSNVVPVVVVVVIDVPTMADAGRFIVALGVSVVFTFLAAGDAPSTDTTGVVDTAVFVLH